VANPIVRHGDDRLLSTPAPLLVPSVVTLSPYLHRLLLLVLGTYDSPTLPFWTRHTFFWLAICILGFGAFGPGIGPCGGGWGPNMGIACLYLVAFACFLLLRRNMRSVFSDLEPVVRLIVNLEHNAAERIRRDRMRLRNRVLALCFSSTAIVVAIWSTFSPQNTENLYVRIFTEECSGRLFFGINISFVCFFFVIFIGATQIALLFSVSQLYVFRLRFLFAVLQQKDMAAIDAELSAETPVAARMLLAAPPRDKEPPLSDGRTPYIYRSPLTTGNADGGGVNRVDSVMRDVDKVLRVYRAIKDEANRHASSWSVPLVVFTVAYFFLFSFFLVQSYAALYKTSVRAYQSASTS
jgi:hypothetical protein